MTHDSMINSFSDTQTLITLPYRMGTAGAQEIPIFVSVYLPNRDYYLSDIYIQLFFFK